MHSGVADGKAGAAIVLWRGGGEDGGGERRAVKRGFRILLFQKVFTSAQQKIFFVRCTYEIEKSKERDIEIYIYIYI